MCQNFLYNGVLVLDGFEHLLASGVLSALGLFSLFVELELVEQHFAHLTRRGEQKFMTCQLVDVGLELLHALRKVLAGLGQRVGVEAHAVHLHACQHGHEWHLYLVEHMGELVFFKFLLERLHELQGDVGVLAGIVANLCGFEVGHVFLLFTLGANQLIDVYGLVAQVYLGQIVHVVSQLGLHQVVGQHGVEHGVGEGNAISVEYGEVVLEVLSYFERVGVFVQRTEYLNHAVRFLRFTWNGNVPGLSAVDGKA